MILKFSDGIYYNTDYISKFVITDNIISLKIAGCSADTREYGTNNHNMCDYEHDKELINLWLSNMEVKE